MPTNSYRRCAETGCPTLVGKHEYCDLHKRTANRYVLYVDASITQNPGGAMRFGWVLYDPLGRVIVTERGYLAGERRTVNEAELGAIRMGLEYFLENHRGEDLVCYSDSKIALAWVRKRPEILELMAGAAGKIVFKQVSRDDNTFADNLASRRRPSRTVIQ